MLTPDQIQQLKASNTNGGVPGVTPTTSMNDDQYEQWKTGAMQTPGSNTQTPTLGDYGNATVKVLEQPLNPFSYGPALSVAKKNIASAPSDIAQAFEGGISTAGQGIGEVMGGESPLAGAESGLKTEAGVGQAAFSLLAPFFKPLGLGTQAIADIVSESPTLQKFAESQAGQATGRAAGDVANAGAVAGSITGAGELAAKLPSTAADIHGAINDFLSKSPDQLPEAAADASSPQSPINALRTYVAKGNVDPRLQASAERLGTPDTSALDTYDEFSGQAKDAVKDVTANPPIATVGDRIGDAYDQVINQRRAVGARMAQELDQVKDIPLDLTSNFENFEQKLADEAGMAYNADEGKLEPTSRQSSMTSVDQGQLEQYISDLNGLGTHSTVGDIDAFLKRIPNELDVAKAAKNITDVTNGERLIKSNLADIRNSLNPETEGTPAELKPYYDARKAYSNLSNFLDEGSKFLGAKQTSAEGGYTRDTSVAKSAAESILNGGKKDWLMKLQGLTGYPALDETVVALQAMKDAGDTRGLSLFKTLIDNPPLTPSGIGMSVLKGTLAVGKRLIVGNKEAQTRQFLNYLDKSDTTNQSASIDTKTQPATVQPNASPTMSTISNSVVPISDSIPPSGSDGNISDTVHQGIVKNGGITINLNGDVPNDGYAYAPNKNSEFQVRQDEYYANPEKYYKEFVDKNADALKDQSNHIGAWVSDGKVYFDVSKVGPPTADTLAEAQKASQLAAFDLGTLNEIPLGKIDGGVYHPLDEASNVYDKYSEQIARATQGGGDGSNQEISGNGSGSDGKNESEGGSEITDSDEFKNFQRWAGHLSDADKKVQEASIGKYLSQKADLLKQYLGQNGNVVNADLARKFFTDVGYNGSNSAAVHEAASQLSKDALAHHINNATHGSGGYFTAGGSGAGKTTILNKEMGANLDNAAFVLDGNLQNYDKATKQIKTAEAAGIKVTVPYVYREPFEAWANGVIKRMLGSGPDAGRAVPLKTFLENTVGSLSTVKKLISDGIPVAGFESIGGGKSKQLSIPEIKNLEIRPDLQKAATAYTEDLVRESKITKEQYESLMADLPHTPYEALAGKTKL